MRHPSSNIAVKIDSDSDADSATDKSEAMRLRNYKWCRDRAEATGNKLDTQKLYGSNVHEAISSNSEADDRPSVSHLAGVAMTHFKRLPKQQMPVRRTYDVHEDHSDCQDSIIANPHPIAKRYLAEALAEPERRRARRRVAMARKSFDHGAPISSIE